jgi:TctA family transporter
MLGRLLEGLGLILVVLALFGLFEQLYLIEERDQIARVSRSRSRRPRP